MTTARQNCRTHILRIMNDIREFYEENIAGIYIVPEEDNLCLVHALVIGPEETPYANGFFYFVLRFPDNYPLAPPSVKLRTTHRGTVRFSPNLYSCGKVCLSILGTWQGPSWCSSQTILSTLLSIRSLMDQNPYYNEPGFEKKINSTDDDNAAKNVSDYNNLITHETLRVAVAEMLQKNSTDAYGMPLALQEIMISYFKMNYQFYENLIEFNQIYEGHFIRDPFKDPYRPKTFDYKCILDKIVKLKDNFSQVEHGSISLYEEITKKTLKASSRDVLKSDACSDENLNEIEEEEEEDLSPLYEPESDDDE